MSHYKSQKSESGALPPPCGGAEPVPPHMSYSINISAQTYSRPGDLVLPPINTEQIQ